MPLDAIIIAEAGDVGSADIIHERLRLDGKVATIQVLKNYLKNNGHVVPPVEGSGIMNWGAAYRLNGIYLLSYLLKSGLHIKLIDRYFKDNETFKEMLADPPRAVVISTTFIRNKQTLHRLVEDIRNQAPDIFIIAGGPFVNLSYRMLQRSSDPGYETRLAENDFLFFQNEQPRVNLYITGLQGEDILLAALQRIRLNRPLDDLPNTVRFDGGKYSFSEQKDYIFNNLNTSISWESLPEKIFRPGVIPVQTSKGCPFRCAFCNFTKDRRLMFIKSLDRLVEELKAVSARGVKFVRFTDDNFRHGKGNLNTLSRRIIQENIPVKWMTMVRATALENVDFELLKKSGCIEVLLGLESADPQILANMNKKANPQLYARVVKRLLAAGIDVSCYFLFGFPGETGETVQKTLDFIRLIEFPELPGTLSWALFPFSVAPLSPVYEPEMRRNYGLTGYMGQWHHRTMASMDVMGHIKRVFNALEHSCPMYRNDNLEMLHDDLLPAERKRLFLTRHRLSKRAIKDNLSKAEIIKAFAFAFPDLNPDAQAPAH
ncbi:MAG: radical SAM protein [Deltaproteobacteria bacterium]|nr:radical SAM protein [Deltaproteobacteria bacterium]